MQSVHQMCKPIGNAKKNTEYNLIKDGEIEFARCGCPQGKVLTQVANT